MRSTEESLEDTGLQILGSHLGLRLINSFVNTRLYVGEEQI